MDEQYRDALQACLEAKRSQHQTTYQYELCANHATAAWATTKGFPWMDLEYANEAAHLRIARMIDSGALTPEEGLLQIQAADARMGQAIHQRVLAAQQRGAIDDQQYRDSLLEFGNRLLQPQYAAPAAPPGRTTCQWVGPQFQCYNW